ncbi:hypothetical protein GPECTOR_102g55 [Gonium pectorale]|uniref:MYND-type domain-containing protein n=1 Tax=Gonium pectorale TaxID=33097 RepID=A0A150FZS6_GONPE|nr:hypothetical protein GPECTOR_102g55 [Gonium pectorale]|eukprot:KXZ43102.1 hypothetical protein GPECTOR_102g55 [Gonium pectorale]
MGLQTGPSPYACALCGARCCGPPRRVGPAAAAPSPEAAPNKRRRLQTAPPEHLVCGGCGAMHYCCEAHRRWHWRHGGHSEECGRMAGQVERGADLAELPFPWARLICCPAPPASTVAVTAAMAGAVGAGAVMAGAVTMLGGRGAGQEPGPPPAPRTEGSGQAGDPGAWLEGAGGAARGHRPPLCALLPGLGVECLGAVGVGGGAGAGGGRGQDDDSGAVEPELEQEPEGDGGGAGRQEPEAHPATRPRGRLPTGGDCRSRSSGRSSSSSGGGSGGGPVGGCRAPGAWRRACSCADAGAGAEVGAGAGVGAEADADALGGPRFCDEADEGSEWGCLQPPLLARVQLRSGAAPDVGRRPPPGSSGAPGRPPAVAGGVVTGPPQKGDAETEEAALPGARRRADVAVAGNGNASFPDVVSGGHEAQGLGAAAAGGGGGGGGWRRLRWGHETWARRVWCLPPHLTPPLSRATVAPAAGLAGGALAAAAGAQPADGKAGSGGVGLPREGPVGVHDWRSYYGWAGLPLESPAALLLHFPLTLYGVLRRVDEHYGGALLQGQRQVTGHGVSDGGGGDGGGGDGPQAELDLLDAFACLLPLLPVGLTLRLAMVGPDVPQRLDGAVLSYDAAGELEVPAAADGGAGVGGQGGGWGSAAGRVAAEESVVPGPDIPAPEAGVTPGSSRGADCCGGRGGGGARLEIRLRSCLLHEAPELLAEGAAEAAEEAGERATEAAEEVGERATEAAKAAGGAQRPPLLIFAPNAGLPAYLSWLPTLELLVAASHPEPWRLPGPSGLAGQGPGGWDRPAGHSAATGAAAAAVSIDEEGHGGGLGEPTGRLRGLLACVFSGYNEEECVRSGQLLERLYGIHTDVRHDVNPFRQPLCCVERVGNDLPSYSNGFLYGWWARKPQGAV